VPVYQGRRLSAWVADLHPHKSLEQQRRTEVALRAIGAEAVPYLLKLLQHREPPLLEELREASWKTKRFLGIEPVYVLSWVESVERQMHLIAAFSALGSSAKPAIPELTELLDDPPATENALLVLDRTPVPAAHRSRFDRDLRPVHLVPGGVIREYLLVFDQNGAHHSRVVGPAKLGIAVGNQVELAVGIDQGKRRPGNGIERNLFVRAFGEILDDVRQEFQLIHQVRILGSVDLGEFNLQKRELLVHASKNLRGDLGGAAMNEFGDL
jgi:hypothetical protein